VTASSTHASGGSRCCRVPLPFPPQMCCRRSVRFAPGDGVATAASHAVDQWRRDARAGISPVRHIRPVVLL
jgi:hypothetical protein